MTKERPLLTATTPISATVEDAAVIQVHYIVITIHFVSLSHRSIVFQCAQIRRHRLLKQKTVRIDFTEWTLNY